MKNSNAGKGSFFVNIPCPVAIKSETAADRAAATRDRFDAQDTFNQMVAENKDAAAKGEDRVHSAIEVHHARCALIDAGGIP